MPTFTTSKQCRKILEKLIIFSAPSGSGKTTVVKHLLEVMDQQLAFSVSATTRNPRPGEVNGREYHFLQLDDFREKIKAEFEDPSEIDDKKKKNFNFLFLSKFSIL
jgi:guanylate kinase